MWFVLSSDLGRKKNLPFNQSFIPLFALFRNSHDPLDTSLWNKLSSSPPASSSGSIVSFKHERGIKVSHYLLISPFILVSIYLTYCSAPMLGAYIFMIVISSWIDHLIIMQCLSLSLFTAFVLKSILSDMSIATPAFFCSLFAWNIFLHPFTFSLHVSLVSRWVSCGQRI